MSFGAVKTSDEPYKGKETIEFNSRAVPGKVLRFMKKRKNCAGTVWVCIGCIELSKKMGSIMPIPEVTTSFGKFVTDPDSPANKHYPMCLHNSTTGAPSGGETSTGRGARKRRSMNEVERYEDTSAYDVINNAPRKKKTKKPDDEESNGQGPSVKDLGLVKFGTANTIMNSALEKDVENKGLVVGPSNKFPGSSWLYEKVKVKDKAFMRCMTCKNRREDDGEGAESDGEFHEGYVKNIDRRIWGDPNKGHRSDCKPISNNQIVAMGLQREILQQLYESNGENGCTFASIYMAARLRVTKRCSAFKAETMRVMTLMEDFKFDYEDLSIPEMIAKLGCKPKPKVNKTVGGIKAENNSNESDSEASGSESNVSLDGAASKNINQNHTQQQLL